MAINNSYIRPQSEVYQLLSTAISQTNGHGAACIVGSQYDVYSYEAGNATEAEFDGSVVLQYATDSTGILKHEVDEKSVQLYLKDVKVSLKESVEVTTEDGDFTVISAPSGKYWAVDADYSGENLVVTDYSLSIGDELVTSDGKKSTVVLGYIANKDNHKVYDKIKVSKNIFNIGSSSYSATVKVCKVYTGTAPQTISFPSGNVSYAPASKVTFTGKNGKKVEGTMIASTGKVYAEFRVRVSYTHPESDPIMILSSVDDIVNNLGSITPQNELAYACYRAISGSQGREVYAVRVHEDTAEGFLTAMQKTEANDRVYAFVPVTNNTDCMDAVVEFNNTLSSPILKKWRITLVGADLDTEQRQVVDPEGKDLVGSVIMQAGTSNYYFEVSEDNINAGFNCNDYAVGDAIDILAEGVTQATLKVTGIVAENVFAVSGATTTQASADFAVKRSDSAQSHIAYVSDLASKFNSRRAVVVWCDGGRSDGRIVSNVHIAAEVAGLTSAVQPQQGLTNTEITTIDSAARMYTKYTQGQLDNIAAHGVMIITQDTADVTPYIRHQLTTTPDKGVLYSELSCTRNIDNISYAVADLIKAYVGKVNITPAAVDTIKGRLISLWNQFTTNSTDNLIGPSLVAYDGVRVEQDPAALDRLVVNVNYYVPSPLNRISVYQMAYVATVNL